MSNISKTAITNSKKLKDTEMSIWAEHWHLLKKNKSAMIGLIIISIIVLTAIFAAVVSPYDPLDMSVENRFHQPFTEGHFLGTDYSGRDIFSRIIYGTRISINVGIISVGIGLSIGMVIGLVSGFYGGWIDRIFMRIIDIMLAFPYILLTILVVAILGPSLSNAMIAIGITFIPRYARIMRSSVLAEKESDYVEAERAIGVSNLELMFKTILPNCLAPLIIQSTLGLGEAILESAALSFLGLGAKPPIPEWGLMIAQAREYITTAWWSVTFPGVAILLAVLGFNLFGDGLRDVLDPRLKD